MAADTDDRIDLALSGIDLFRFDGSVTTPVNGLDFIAAAAGSEPAIAAVGTDTDIDVELTPKGTGDVTFGGVVAPTSPDIQGQTFTGFNDTGAVNAYVITPVPAITAYAKYQAWWVDFANANTSASTMNINALGVRNIFDFRTGAALVGDEIKAGLGLVVDDGTQLILMTPTQASINITKATDETVTSSTTLQDDDELKYALGVNQNIRFEADILYKGVVASDIKLGFTVPTGAALRWSAVSGMKHNLDLTLGTMTEKNASGAAESFGVAAAGATKRMSLRGVVANGGNAGDLQLVWAQNISDASPATVEAESLLVVHPL